jgi:hypothetical protein
VAEFLERDPLDDQQVSILTDYLHINKFRNNSAVNFDILANIGILNDGEEAFIRKGMEYKHSKFYS